MSNEIIINERGFVFGNYSELELIAKKILDSGISKAGNSTQIALIILRGKTIGIDLFESLECIHVINGKTCLSGDLAMALVERSGLIEDKNHTFSGKGSDRACSVTVIRKGRTPKTWNYSMAEAKIAGLLDKKASPWLTFPDRMFYYRALGFALRGEFPDVLRGMHLAEEFDRIDATAPMPEAKVIESITVEPEPEPPPQAEEKQEGPPAPAPVDGDNNSSQAKLLELASRDGISEEALLQVLRKMKHTEADSIAAIPEEKAKLFVRNWSIIKGKIK